MMWRHPSVATGSAPANQGETHADIRAGLAHRRSLDRQTDAIVAFKKFVLQWDALSETERFAVLDDVAPGVKRIAKEVGGLRRG